MVVGGVDVVDACTCNTTDSGNAYARVMRAAYCGRPGEFARAAVLICRADAGEGDGAAAVAYDAMARRGRVHAGRGSAGANTWH